MGSSAYCEYVGASQAAEGAYLGCLVITDGNTIVLSSEELSETECSDASSALLMTRRSRFRRSWLDTFPPFSPIWEIRPIYC